MKQLIKKVICNERLYGMKVVKVDANITEPIPLITFMFEETNGDRLEIQFKVTDFQARAKEWVVL